MKLLGTYLRQRRGVLGLFLLFGGIFAATFALYGLPLAAVWYPAALCAAVGLLAAALDFRRWRQRHEELTRIRDGNEAALGELPPAQSLLEADYQRILRLMAEEQALRRTEAGRRYDEMVDYYTVWAHQIKTPIASMRLTLQNEDSALSRRLQAELLRIEQYVEMVLVFLRLDSASTDYLIREYKLDDIVRPAVRKLAGEFIGRRLTLTYEPLDTTVVTDEKWLSFVVEQVLSNALKYTPSGGVTITLESPKTLCIRDTGMGIAPEDLPRIFEKGYTGRHGRTDRRASGIGLYLCRRICAALGHTIRAESAPDRGTVIRIGLEQRALEQE